MRHGHNSATPGAIRILALLFCFIAAASAAPDSPLSSTNIFAPASTPAKTIFGLSMFVLAVTAVIFVVVGSLLAYSVVKFRGRAIDSGREPAQVYGSTQIELAWTVIPVLIVAVLFLATARVIHAIQDAPKPAAALDVTVIGHQFWWEFRYPEARHRHRKRAAHSGKRSRASHAHFPEAALGRHRPQLLGPGTRGQNRSDSEPRERDVARPAAARNLPRPMRAVLRNAARQNAVARLGGPARGFCRLGQCPAAGRGSRRDG